MEQQCQQLIARAHTARSYFPTTKLEVREKGILRWHTAMASLVARRHQNKSDTAILRLYVRSSTLLHTVSILPSVATFRQIAHDLHNQPCCIFAATFQRFCRSHATCMACSNHLFHALKRAA